MKPPELARRATALDTVAAVDLGSNSFHMVVARHAHGQLHPLDRLRQRVGLAEGIRKDKTLKASVAARALECLERFGQRLRDMPKHSVRAVGTNTFRQLEDDGRFLEEASAALGHRIEVVSGAEEARLIYLGVAQTSPSPAGKRLVLDIGGGSTELIVGEGFETLRSHSLHMGCVSFSRRYFGDGKLTLRRFEDAVMAALLELRSIKRPLRKAGWVEAFGASGTIFAVGEILRANGWTNGDVTREGLRALRDVIVAARRVDAIDLPGLSAERRPVLVGGVAVLTATFQSLRIDRMAVSAGALREGVLYDLLGRISHEDVRDRTIRMFTERFHVDAEQAERVEQTAQTLFDDVAAAWGLDPVDDRAMLGWAARLHEIGLSVSFSGYHRHGAYLAEHAVMPGFSRDDQRVLAVLIGVHRRKIRRETFERLPPSRTASVLRLCGLLRVAVRLHRSRTARPLPALRLTARRTALALRFPGGWLERHPLTRATLEAEAGLIESLGFELTFT